MIVLWEVLFLFITNSVMCDNSLFDAVFWEVKPYIFTDDQGKIDGVFPMIFSQASRYCLKEKQNQTIMKYLYKMTSRRSFLDTFKKSVGNGNHVNNSSITSKDVWFPAMYRDLDPIMRAAEQAKGYKLFQITTSNELAVIFPRSHISLINKVARGILNCEQIFFMTFLLAVFFGVLMWLFERLSHPDFPKSCIQGAGTGLWWSFTIGYGDIVPRSVPGRLTAVVWVAIAIMVASVMTASITESVTGTSDLSIRGKKVAVLEDSFELYHIVNDFNANPVTASSYESVIEKVRSGEASTGVMNAEVAAWYVNEIHDDDGPNPLRIVNKLPANLYINILISGNISAPGKTLFRCMRDHADEVYTRSIKSFSRFCPSETLYLDSIGSIVRNNLFVQILMAIIPALLLLGMVVNLFCSSNKHEDEERNRHGGGDEEKIVLTTTTRAKNVGADVADRRTLLVSPISKQ